MAVEQLRRDAETVLLDLVRVGDHPTGVDVARAGHVGQACSDEPAGAGLGGGEPEAERATALDDDLGDGPVVLGEEIARELRAQSILDLRRPLLSPCSLQQVDPDLQIVRAHRHLEAVVFSARPLQHPGDSRLARAEEPENATARCLRAGKQPLQPVGLEHAPPEPAQLVGRPGQGDGEPLVALEQHGGRGAGETEGDRPVREGRLLADAFGEVRVRSAEPLGDCAGDLLDLPDEVAVNTQLPAGGAGECLDRAVVVGRAEAAREHAQLRLQSFAHRPLRALPGRLRR